jgi:hypothetical protein
MRGKRSTGGATVALTCEHCGASFMRRPSSLTQVGQGRFCSPSCRAKHRTGARNGSWRGGPVACACARCGARVTVSRTRFGKGAPFYCSPRCGLLANAPWQGKTKAPPPVRPCPKCRDRMRREARRHTCVECGIVFDAPRSAGRRFCSQHCRAVWWGKRTRATAPPVKLKGVSLRTSEAARTEHKEWRAKVYQRDQWRCQWCGVGAHLQAHHIKSWAAHPDLRTDVDNGVTLCIDCHREWHRLYGRPRRTTAIAPLPSPTDQAATMRTAG